MYKDETLITFGKYKYKALCRVPAHYLLHLYETKYPDDKLLEYIENNMEVIIAKKDGKIPYPESDIDFTLSGRAGNDIKLICKYSNKIIFQTQKDAKYEIRRIQNTEQKNKKPTREYECKKCGGWHLTSQEFKQ